ncbi:filamentous hemagglutinin N-terminal domain-containing protein [Pandoraea fibrosis]|uniref:Filamentous hemagglutinin N-terminal domain-containing protein n=1 Tax=Pandoraea fibrosis TaxID=1891094 RepID=A0ABX6HSD4_9BURK|nr:filamentous hemagglutinin N-terminal domain-containing protein [Pandoraea fibrosis]QHE93037.1 filamentous hemagglutinin N-terminal domain-containing protein [Pandoraea fibrosis]QHF13405.1 filamentous hemagglutinin N-terminal domain-containing protein [Pandoraea fibrosis]
MNKNQFRKVFSERLGMLVAVGEDAKSQDKGLGAGNGGGAVADVHVVSDIKGVVLAIVLALAETTAFAQSLPTGGQYTAGSGTISTNGGTMTVDQNTQRGVINWNTFNVGSGNTVQFNQPNAQSKTLNIVSGGVPSNIQGSLLANGQIFIQNSSGILFGKGAVVNVGSLLATTKAIDPNAFMNGDVLTLSSTGKSGLVQNDGNIQASGFVTLMGDQVRNTGSITVPGGQVVLAAGDSATVALANGQGLSLTLTNATASALVENSGQIVADNGSVLLTARGSDTLLKTVINMSGVVQAGSGAIVADAGSTGDVIVTGKLDASNLSAGGVGGDVVLSGNRIGLSDTARIDVSGDGDAGYAVIGGDTLHKISGTKAAALIDNVTFADAVQIDRGAQIMARSVHGNGGFLETSGRYLNMQGQVDASAPNGKNGSWLIDPTDVTISTDDDTNYTGPLGNGTFNWNTGSETAVVNNGSLVDALNSGTDVTITTASDGPATGNISVKADIVTHSAQSANLTLLANNSLYIGDQTDARIAADGDGALNVNMVAIDGTAYVGSTGNTVTFDTKGNVSITGGSETSGAVGLQLAGNVNVLSGNVALTGASDSQNAVDAVKNSSLNVTGGRLRVDGTSGSGVGVHLTSLLVSGSGAVEINGSGQTGVSLSSLNVSDTGAANISGQTSRSGGYGISITNANASGHGEIYLHGTSSATTGVGYGVYVSATSAAQDSLVRIEGESNGGDNGVGIYIKNATVRDNGSAIFSGSSSGAGDAAYVYAMLVLDQAKLDVTGTATGSGVGVDATNINTLVNGSINISGTSADGDGSRINGAVGVGSNSEVNVSGNSTNGNGTVLGAGGSVTISGCGTFDISGGSANGTGTLINGGVNVSNTGTANITGNSTEGNGTVIHGSMNVSGSGTLDIGGSSANSTGTLVDLNGSIRTADNGATTIKGNSTDGPGVLVNGTLNVSGSGTLDISGNSANSTGTLVDLNGSMGTTDNGATSIKGNSTDGAGVLINGTVNVSGNGALDISGNSANSTGTLVDSNGSVSTIDQGSSNVAGRSTDGTGVVVNGSFNVSGNGSANVSGHSADGKSLVGEFTASDDSSIYVTAPGAGEGDIVLHLSGNVKWGLDILPENTTPIDPTDPVNPTNPTDPTNNTPENPTSGDSGGGHSNTGAIVGGVLGAAGIGGALVMSAHGVMYLEQPAELIVDIGDLSYWGRVSLEHLQIDLKGGQAELALRSPTGPLKRQLKLLDGGDGVKHYASVDAKTGVKSDLTFDPKTSEYFYTETGMKAGQPYKVSAHGWLKAHTSIGAPAPLPESASWAIRPSANAK